MPATWSPAAVRRDSLIRDARILRDRGLTLHQIATTLGVPTATIGRWLA